MTYIQCISEVGYIMLVTVKFRVNEFRQVISNNLNDGGNAHAYGYMLVIQLNDKSQ